MAEEAFVLREGKSLANFSEPTEYSGCSRFYSTKPGKSGRLASTSVTNRLHVWNPNVCTNVSLIVILASAWFSFDHFAALSLS